MPQNFKYKFDADIEEKREQIPMKRKSENKKIKATIH